MSTESLPRPTQEQPKKSSESQQMPASRRRGDFGVAAGKRLEMLESEVERLKAESESNPDAQRALSLAEKRVELFVYEHDNAGAFKFKKFGREVMGMFEEQEGKPKLIEVNKETGEMVLAESEKNRRVMFVNMGELDRINKEGGGHAAGDSALKETVHAIENAVRARISGKEGRKADYTMLRYRGNEFMVSFDDISREDFDAILEEVRLAQPKVDGVGDPVPLVTDGFDFQESIDIVNQLQAELSPDERITGENSGAAAREVIEVMKNRADWSLDVDKFVNRVTRVKDKLRGSDAAEAKAFYDNYMAKMFRGTELTDLESFERLSQEDTERLAFEYAGKNLADAKDENAAKRAIVDQRLRDIRRRRGPVTSYPQSLAPAADVKLATVPNMTEGRRAVAEKSLLLGQAEASGDKSAVEDASLDYQIERARRDGGTGLLERGVHYEDLENAFKQDKKVSMAFVDMGFLRYFDNKGGSDVGDNALKIAADLMEKAIAKSGVEGKAYRYGGDEFTVQIDGGDAELAKFQAALSELRDAAGAVPAGRRGGADGYVPTELVFNAGSSDTELASSVFESLREAGHYDESQLADPDEVANLKADLMTVIADKSIETDKAVNRFLMLTEALRDPQYGQSKDRTTQVDMLISFSNKALFAEAGGAEYLRSLAASEKSPDEVRKDVETWVAERVRANHEKESKKEGLLSELIEVHGKIRYYERALAEARHETEAAKAQNEQLLAELKRVKEERQALIEARKSLS